LKVRATLSDVAREAGFSSATVDRVLNGRPGVRSYTRDIILDTARRLGYGLDIGAGDGLNKAGSLRLDFILPSGSNAFMQKLREQIEEQAAPRAGVDARVHIVEDFRPDKLAQALDELRGKTDGVGVIALDHPTVREAIRSLAADGVKVVTLVSDILSVPRVAYIGIDNRAAGRLAGYLAGRFMGTGKTGKVALFAGSLSYRGHEEREMGFRHILAEENPGLQIVELREMGDDNARAYAEAKALLERHPDLSAIYNIGAGNPGIARALKECGRARSVVFVGHEVTEDTKPLLLDGTLDAVIDQNPRVEAREALNTLIHSLRQEPNIAHPPRLQVVFKENIPEV
jgi:LacI family transcriptional regulator